MYTTKRSAEAQVAQKRSFGTEPRTLHALSKVRVIPLTLPFKRWYLRAKICQFLTVLEIHAAKELKRPANHKRLFRLIFLISHSHQEIQITRGGQRTFLIHTKGYKLHVSRTDNTSICDRVFHVWTDAPRVNETYRGDRNLHKHYTRVYLVRTRHRHVNVSSTCNFGETCLILRVSPERDTKRTLNVKIATHVVWN